MSTKAMETVIQPVVLSIPQASTYLSVSPDTVRRLIRKGTIPHARIGNSIRIRRADLDVYLEHQISRQCATKNSSFSKLIKTMRLPQLYSLVQGLEGKKCWKAAFGYGGELYLHFGARLPCHNPNVAGESKGAWIFGTCGTPWHLVTSEGSVSSENHREKELVSQIEELAGTTVTNVAISLPDGAITIYFTNRGRLLVTPTARDRHSDVPYWELFMPNHRLLAFGPGVGWSHSRSDTTPQRQSRAGGKVGLSNIVAKTFRAGVS